MLKKSTWNNLSIFDDYDKYIEYLIMYSDKLKNGCYISRIPLWRGEELYVCFKSKKFPVRRIILEHKLGRTLHRGSKCFSYCKDKRCVNPEHLYERDVKVIKKVIEMLKNKKIAKKLTMNEMELIVRMLAFGMKHNEIAHIIGCSEIYIHKIAVLDRRSKDLTTMLEKLLNEIEEDDRGRNRT